MILPMLPLPEPLRGSATGSFAYFTLSERLPNIAHRLLQENSWPAEIAGRVQALIDDMPSGRLIPLQDPGAPDLVDWERNLAPYLEQTWLTAPWFVAEVYFFRRLLQATGYFKAGAGRGVDPYASQKRRTLPTLEPDLRRTCATLDSSFSSQAPLSPQTLASLLHSATWGNQADLSLWPDARQAKPERPEIDQQADQLLVDDAFVASQYLFNLDKHPVRVDFVLDNVGMELAYDLALADFLLRSQIVQLVFFRLKPFPTYVSDATASDVLEVLDFLAGASDAHVRGLALRMRRCLDEGSWRLVSDYYWTSPLAGWDMPPSLSQELAQSDLIISKGDANYRRWVGDRAWPFTTPIKDVLNYLPFSWLALRVLKAEMIAGLRPGLPEEMDRKDPQWLYDGRWGIIQFVRPEI